VGVRIALVSGTILAWLCASVLGGCGYHVVGRSAVLPGSVKTIGVLPLENRTNQYRIEQRLTAALVREFLAKTSYRIVPDAKQADAVLRGRITSLESSAVLFDAATGRATTMLVTLRCEVVLEERETRKVLYRNDNFLFRDEYEISTDLKSFFEERDPALDRMARTFAERLVAAIVEGF
jgi:outer membrane lipopolysaccharide assembly protein LptE/RlpB